MRDVTGWIFYVIFAVVLAGIYLSIRRRWAPPGLVAGVGTIGSIISMFLISLAQQNNILQAVVVSILVGALFSGVTLAVAWYFQSQDSQQPRYQPEQHGQYKQHEQHEQHEQEYVEHEPQQMIHDEDY